MVGDDAQRDVGLFILLVGNICNAADVLHDVLHGVYLEQVAYILHDAGKALQTHAGVDVWFWHPLVMSVAVRVELREYQVPDFHVAVAVAADLTLRSAAATAFAAVKINFRAGTARTGAMLPEVVLFAKANDALRRDAYLFGPDFCRFIVLFVNRNPQLVRRNFQDTGQKFPCPCGCLYLEIVAEGKVSQHLKVGTVAVIMSYAVDIRCADTLLAGGHTVIWRCFQSQEVFFQRRHAGVNQQKALVILWHQRGAWQPGVTLAFKEG